MRRCNRAWSWSGQQPGHDNGTSRFQVNDKTGDSTNSTVIVGRLAAAVVRSTNPGVRVITSLALPARTKDVKVTAEAAAALAVSILSKGGEIGVAGPGIDCGECLGACQENNMVVSCNQQQEKHQPTSVRAHLWW